MYNIIILGSTSNICANRVFKNINKISNLIDKIYCFGFEQWDTPMFLDYFSKNVSMNDDLITHKIKFLSGEYNLISYNRILKNIISKNTIIYVATPAFCYPDIISFVNSLKDFQIKLVLEKPLALDYNNFKKLLPLFTKNISMIDHFLFKYDIIKIINTYKHKEFRLFKIAFIYKDDVESRLGYYDIAGCFIDMFQSHYLAILYSIIADKIIDFKDNMVIVKNVRKRYDNYGGVNKIDTYFYLEILWSGITLIFESGKAFESEKKIIQIDNEEYTIKNYENEYELFFKDLIENKNDNSLIFKSEVFWNITNIINEDFYKNNTIGRYTNFNLSS